MRPPTAGRRERKKAQTRTALAEEALRMFLARGFDQVSVKEIADVSVTTLFKHFPSKEALVFDRDAEIESSLAGAVRNRPDGQDVLAALREHFLARLTSPSGHRPNALAEFREMVHRTQALREYAQNMWLRHENALAEAIREAVGADEHDVTVRAITRFVLDVPHIAHAGPNPEAAINTVFDMPAAAWKHRST